MAITGGTPGTSRARGPTFAQLSRSAGVSLAGAGKSSAPFSGPQAAAHKERYAHYSGTAQGAIARALREPLVLAELDTNEGTAPELVVLGYFLQGSYALERDLFFQTATFQSAAFNRSGRRFPVDILVVQGGDKVHIPVDGKAFHAQTILQVLRDDERNRLLSAYGRVVPVSDAECVSIPRLEGYLMGEGVVR